MDIQKLTAMLTDKHFLDYGRLSRKYPDDFADFLEALKLLYYKPLPLLDFNGSSAVYIKDHADIDFGAIRLLMQPQNASFGIRAATEEIIASSAIENIDFSRDSVRNILKGLAPTDEVENRILGQKKGIEFISDTSNKITEENIHTLYMTTIGQFLTGDERLLEERLYRHDTVFVMSDHVEHSGIDHRKLPEYMGRLVEFINADDGMNDLVKAAIIHFYIAYLHPYFDGNGRMARLMHLWFLVQKGYRSAMFIPMSGHIERSRSAYYAAYTAVEDNMKFSGTLDLTPFIMYFAENVYSRLRQDSVSDNVLEKYKTALDKGIVTEKETELWRYVLSGYGTSEFSTKQLEKDFGKAAYATIRTFVLKFKALGLLEASQYGNRVKYRVCGGDSPTTK